MSADGGPSIWCNIGVSSEAPGVLEMLNRLQDRVPDLRVVLTVGRMVHLPGPLPDFTTLGTKPYDLAPSVDNFLSEHTPDAAVLTGAEIFPAAISGCRYKSVPVVLANARVRERSRLYDRFFDFQLGPKLRVFERILAVASEDAAYYIQKGANEDRIEVVGPLESVPEPPVCDAGEADYLAELMATRPVWLAAGLPVGEFPVVEAAFRTVSRLAHRLLLIVTPADPSEAAEARAHFERAGWATAQREDGAEPESEVQVYVADAPGEDGIWYRLAPVTYLGGTLSGKPFADPFAAAALGSVILHGDQLRSVSPWLEQLMNARACRQVRDSETLADAVSDLLAPDKAAQMAARAWDISTRAAAASERTADVLQDLLENAQA